MSKSADPDAVGQPSAHGVAIIGLAGRFPGAANPRQLWHSLRNGTVEISHFRDEELEDSFDAQTRCSPQFVKARGVLCGVDLFDAEFFRMLPREAALTDPQQRVLLECAWEALEDAGYDPATYKGDIGVFVGTALNTYFLRNVCGTREAVEEFTSQFQVGNYQELLGNLRDLAATRLSYKLDLRGPGVTIQSACSTSLLAVAQACQSLQLYQADMALAGGVSITFPQKRGYIHQAGGMVSPDGRCRPFDASAAGTVFGSGAGIVILKRLDEALRDGDHVYAVICGYGVNNDGAAKVGFTAPSADRQAASIVAAHAMAGIDARSIDYVECHGTATPLGDPIEFEGLVKAFRETTHDKGFCTLGSVKANVGHLDIAAGVTGLMAATLGLYHEEIPPLANFISPNPHIDAADSPFLFAQERRPWPRSARPRRAGVSAFGVGGTNVHIVLEEAPLASRRLHGSPSAAVPSILPISARSDTSLLSMTATLADHLEAQRDASLPDVAFTLQEGRHGFDRRVAVIAGEREEAVRSLRLLGPAGIRKRVANPSVVFMFPGQGSQYAGMGASLYQVEPVFRHQVDEAARMLEPLLDLDIREHLLSGQGADGGHALDATALAQPALLVVEHALARTLMSYGVIPTAMIGHSIGEVVAACISGVFSLQEAILLVAARGALMQKQTAGAMLSVRLSENELRRLLEPGLCVAAVNSPSLCVASGPIPAIERLVAHCVADGVMHRRLHTSHAFHSAMMDPVTGPLEARLASLPFGEQRIPIVSTVTGKWITEGEASTAAYWGRQCREPVRFADGLATLRATFEAVLVEVGPGIALSTFAAQTIPAAKQQGVIAAMPEFCERGQSLQAFAECLADLWVRGVTIDWSRQPNRGSRVPLPTYAFDRKRHWIEPSTSGLGRRPAEAMRPSEQQAVAREPAMAATIVQTPVTEPTLSSTDRRLGVQTTIIELLANLMGESPTGADPSTTFVEMGLDSLMLGQLTQQLNKRYSAKLTFRRLLREYPTIIALATHIEAALPAEPASKSAPTRPESAPSPVAAQRSLPRLSVPAVHNGGLEVLMLDQLGQMQLLIGQQLQALRDHVAAQQIPTADGLAPTGVPVSPAAPSAASGNAASDEEPSRFRMYRSGKQAVVGQSSEPQRRFIGRLIEAYNAKTPGSKLLTQRYRQVLADPRTASGFSSEWKEMVYPLVCQRAKGSKIWDIEGNEYVDLVNGYGQTAFGHAPDFVVEAIERQLKDGFAIGPQSPLAGEVAELFCEMTGNERVTFCNTGSEAVMAAMRVARAVTGRSRVAVFGGAYHGQFDEVLVKGRSKSIVPARPIASGIPPESVSNITILPYDTSESLEWVRANAGDLAAVLVEPVQSRHPSLQPKAFLEQLREITSASDTALIIDEVVTGFRTHPGGIQSLFGIRADLASYGKVVGGGMPIGVLAGKAKFMDALDGGYWAFGDSSSPEVSPTFFAGTFVRHPLVLAATRAVLLHLKQQGAGLQEGLAKCTSELVARLNLDLARRGEATRIETFSSWFYIDFSTLGPLASLFFFAMRLRGVHIQEGFPAFLTTAHTKADIELIARAFQESLDDLQSGGIIGAQVSAPHVASPQRSLNSVATPDPDEASVDVPLTEPQTEVLLAAQLGDAASCAFNEFVSFEFAGPIDSQALNLALNDVVSHHEALRASFAIGAYKMRINPRMPVALRVEQRSEAAQTEQRLAALLEEEGCTPFNLVEGPLLRATLLETATRSAVLVLTAHHIVCDGWSMNIVATDLAAAYGARARGSPPTLSAPVSLRQFALDSARPNSDRARSEAYWLGQFKALPPPLDLPLDHPRPAIKTFRGASATDFLDAGLCKSVRQAGARHGATMFATLLASVQVLLARLSGQSDIVIGVPIAGQALLEDGNLVGHCVNFLPIRTVVDVKEGFATHLKAVNARLLAALDHQDYTFGTLVQKLGVARDVNRTPLTDIQFNLEKLAGNLSFAEVRATLKPNAKAAVNFDLFFNLGESDAGIRIDVDYNTDIFEEATILRWLGHLKVLLSEIVADAQRPVADLPLLSASQRSNGGARAQRLEAYPRDLTVHAVLLRQVQRLGDVTALVGASGSVTYREMEQRSSQFARYLADHGVVAGSRVGLYCHRSTDAIIAMLGILKSGAAYVPFDPNYPAEQIRFMIEDSAPVLLLVQASMKRVDLAHSAAAVGLVDLEDALEESLGRPALPLEEYASPEAAAYVMYTSGSTGRPKGVVVHHRAIVHLVCGQSYAQLDETTTMLHLAPLAFDASTFEIWGALLNGGKLVIVSDAHPSLASITGTIADHAVTTAWFTAGLFHALVDEDVGGLKQLRQLLAGGDVLSSAHVNEALLQLSDCQLVNGYGPTETTTFACCFRIPRDGWGGGSVPIGVPLAGTQVYVCEPNGELVLPGAIGELYIGGDGVALGYLNRPELTAERFVADRHGGLPGARAYRTGDLVRMRNDGVIEFHGRIDNQVKINGYRVEPGEIETAMTSHPDVAEAVVIAAGSSAGAKVLLGYVTLAKNAAERDRTTLQRSLTAHLSARLPRHMIPGGIKIMEAMPRTPNGKIARDALPPIGPDEKGKERVIVAPRTPMEGKILSVWSEVLERPIGVEDSFFQLGANSLHVFRIASRFNALSIPLEARHLMGNPTVAELAQMVERGRSKVVTLEAVPALRDFRRGARRSKETR